MLPRSGPDNESSRGYTTAEGRGRSQPTPQPGVAVRAQSMRGLAEEAPEAYKDVDEVVDSVANAGLARRVARVRPIAVIKG